MVEEAPARQQRVACGALVQCGTSSAVWLATANGALTTTRAGGEMVAAIEYRAL